MFFIRVFIILCFIYMGQTARILALFGTPIYSHQIVPRALLLELQSRGHELVVFTTDPLKEKAPSNYKEYDLSFMYKYVVKEDCSTAVTKNRIINKFEVMTGGDIMSKEFYSMEIVKDFLNNKNEHFDLVIAEWSAHASAAAYSEHFKCPIIGFRPLGLRVEAHDVVANPVTPSYISTAFMEHSEDFIGRVSNFMLVVLSRLMFKYIFLPNAEEIVQKHFPNHNVHLEELERNVSLIFTYTNPVLMGVRPLVPAIVEIGGLHLKKEPEELPENIKTYLDNSKQGVILFSLGSMVSSSLISQEKLNILIETLLELPFNIILKLEDNPFDKTIKNVLCLKWIPQESILVHPNVRLFVSHGGLLSIWESVFNHVPMIGIPFHSDHFFNVHRLVKLGIGLHVDFTTLTKTILKEAINEVINNQSYKIRTKEVAEIIKDQPMSPMEKAVWWTEYVLRHKGAPHFRSKAVGMPWYIYYSLDVICFIIFILMIISYIVYRILKFIHSIICIENNKKKIQ